MKIKIEREKTRITLMVNRCMIRFFLRLLRKLWFLLAFHGLMNRRCDDSTYLLAYFNGASDGVPASSRVESVYMRDNRE